LFAVNPWRLFDLIFGLSNWTPYLRVPAYISWQLMSIQVTY